MAMKFVTGEGQNTSLQLNKSYFTTCLYLDAQLSTLLHAKCNYRVKLC